MMIGIKTKEGLWGKLPLFLSEDLRGRGWLLSASPLSCPLAWIHTKPNLQSSFLKMDNLEGKKNKQEWIFSLTAEMFPLPFHTTPSPSRTTKAVIIYIFSHNSWRASPKTWKWCAAFTLRLCEHCQARPGMSQDDRSNVTPASRGMCSPSIKHSPSAVEAVVSVSNHPYGGSGEDYGSHDPLMPLSFLALPSLSQASLLRLHVGLVTRGHLYSIAV